MPDPRTQRHHLVSQWYQRKFADSQRYLVVLDARTGRVVAGRRAVRHNFVVAGYNTQVNEDGLADARLEQFFSIVESRIAAQLTDLRSPSITAEQHVAIAAHFALHLVRSEGFHLLSEHLVEKARHKWVPRIARDPALLAQCREIGLDPSTDELADFATRILNEHAAANRFHVEGMFRQYGRLLSVFVGMHFQIIDAEPLGTGFALADVPITHAHTSTGRYGLRDRVGVSDANLLIGPLSRFLAVAVSNCPLPPVIVTTKRRLHEINAVFIRGALSEVACHPDDAREVRRVCDHAHDLPPTRLVAS